MLASHTPDTLRGCALNAMQEVLQLSNALVPGPLQIIAILQCPLAIINPQAVMVSAGSRLYKSMRQS